MNESKQHATYKQVLLELANQIRNNPKDEPVEKSDFTPIGISKTNNQLPYDDSIMFERLDEAEVIKRLGRKKKWNLTLLKPFVDVMKYKASAKHVSLMPIACTSSFFKMIYKSHQNVSNMLDIAQKVNLLKCVDSTYSFSNSSAKAKLYAYNKLVESILLGLFKQFNIQYHKSHININQSYINNISENIREQDLNDASRRFKVKVASKTHLPLSNEIAAKLLLERYPQVKELWDTLDEDNASLEADEWTYAPFNIERGGRLKDSFIKKIGFRARNSYCSAKVHNITELDYQSGRVLRDEVVKAKFGAIYEQDVKSSIYRITYLLNKGVWLDDSIDLYEEIAGFKFDSPEERDLFKRPFCQSLYFSSSAKDMRAKVCWQHSATKKWIESNYGEAAILQAKEKMERAIGFSYRSEIFLHESCIYAQVAHELRQRGYKVFQVYDGFFTDKALSREEFNSIVEDKALYYYHKYIKHNTHNNHHNNKYTNTNNISENIRERQPKAMTNRPWHPTNDIPKEAERSSKQVTHKAQLPKEVIEQFRPERLQHFVTSLYISESEAARIARITNQHLTIKPSKSGFSYHDAWSHHKQRRVIFGYLCKHLQNILNDEDAKWVVESLKAAKRD